jgi:hypothetical protein
VSVKDVSRTDLALLDVPSVYDFRTSVIMHGPIADAVPSANEFEMYPVGLTSIASYLSANHYNVRIINLAYLMLARRDFDVEAYVARLHPKIFGIDLHWLPHAQGALAIAEMVKRHHPEIPVLMGGLSASYYHEELAAYPFVDYVLRGDPRSLERSLRELGWVIEGQATGWPVLARARRTSRLARHAVAEVDDSRAEGAGLDEVEIHPALALGKERNATANQHRVDPGPVLVDQAQRGRLGGESRAADRDVALRRPGSQPLDLLRQAAGGQAGIALHRRQRGGEHHLRERLPDRGPLEH